MRGCFGKKNRVIGTAAALVILRVMAWQFKLGMAKVLWGEIWDWRDNERSPNGGNAIPRQSQSTNLKFWLNFDKLGNDMLCQGMFLDMRISIGSARFADTNL